VFVHFQADLKNCEVTGGGQELLIFPKSAKRGKNVGGSKLKFIKSDIHKL
jgi:hypothetical protein